MGAVGHTVPVHSHPLTAAVLLDVAHLEGDLGRVRAGATAALHGADGAIGDLLGDELEAAPWADYATLALLAGRSVSGPAPVAEVVVTGAAAVEMAARGATLHDDATVDDRSGEATSGLGPTSRAILVGDLLLARAAELVAAASSVAAGLLARSVAEFCEGALLRHRSGDSLAVAERTTGAMAASACGIAALLAGAPPAVVDGHRCVGAVLGQALHIAAADAGTREVVGGRLATLDDVPLGDDLRTAVETLRGLLADS